MISRPVAKYTGRAHVVQPPIGCRYTAVAAGVRHACGAGVGATYCLRSDGLVDRITTTTGGMEGGMMPYKRSAPVRATLSTPDGVTYTAVIAGYYASYLVRSDGALDVLSETRAQGNKEVSEGGRLECTIPAPAGTAYVGMVAHGIGGKFGRLRSSGSCVGSGCNASNSESPHRTSTRTHEHADADETAQRTRYASRTPARDLNSP